jgi:hypothetical protein
MVHELIEFLLNLMMNAGSVFSRRFNSNGPERVVQDYKKSYPLFSSDLSKYVKALISIELRPPGNRRFLSQISFKLLLFPCRNDVQFVLTLVCLQDELQIQPLIQKQI